MYLSREIDIKLGQIDTKIHIFILYKSCSIKQIRHQFKNAYTQQEPDNLRLAPIIIF